MGISLCMGIISGGSIKTDTVACILSIATHLPADVHLSLPVGGYAAQNRNMVVDMALEAKDTHIVFIDSDMIFPPKSVEKLLSHDKDIVGVNYHQRQIKPISTVKMIGPDGRYICGTEKDLPDVLFEAGGVGTGFCLINTNVFKKMEYPYFRADYLPDEFNKGQLEFNTEDIYFCKEARKLGFHVWCDPTIIVQHLGDFKY